MSFENPFLNINSFRYDNLDVKKVITYFPNKLRIDALSEGDLYDFYMSQLEELRNDFENLKRTKANLSDTEFNDLLNNVSNNSENAIGQVSDALLDYERQKVGLTYPGFTQLLNQDGEASGVLYKFVNDDINFSNQNLQIVSMFYEPGFSSQNYIYQPLYIDFKNFNSSKSFYVSIERVEFDSYILLMKSDDEVVDSSELSPINLSYLIDIGSSPSNAVNDFFGFNFDNLNEFNSKGLIPPTGFDSTRKIYIDRAGVSEASQALLNWTGYRAVGSTQTSDDEKLLNYDLQYMRYIGKVYYNMTDVDGVKISEFESDIIFVNYYNDYNPDSPFRIDIPNLDWLRGWRYYGI